LKSLNEKHAEMTRELVLEAVIELIKDHEVDSLSLKKIAEHAGMSERTLYRHFSNRDLLMEALAVKLHQQLDLPSTPPRADELPDMAGTLYRKLDAKPHIVLAILHSELYGQILNSKAKDRWDAVKQLLAERYPETPEKLRDMTAANIRYYLNATTWHYYRYKFQLDLDTCIQCAQLAIEQALKGLSEIAK